MENTFEINVAYLYPDLLNIYGDLGNISAIKHRLNWRNINVNIDNISINDDMNYDKYDIYYIGGGSQETQQELVAHDLQRHKSAFKTLADNGTVILAVDAGYQLFCDYYITKQKKQIDGLGIFHAHTIIDDKRLTGNVTLKSNLHNIDTIVGFENHNALTYLESDTKSLGEVLIGNGNNTTDKHEGAIYNLVIGTYLHGPILPKNPLLCDFLIESAMKKKLNDSSYTLEKIDDILENLAHNELIKKAY